MSTSALSAYEALPVSKIALADTTIHYRSIGTGPPLLMIHGWPLCGATFREYVAAMQTRWTCIVPDLPGSGASPWDPTTENMLEDWGRLMQEFVDAIGLSRFSVLAHDSGATIARVMAAQLGDRVASMVMGNTEISNHTSARLAALQAGFRVPGAAKLMRKLFSSRTFLRSEGGFSGTFADVDFLDGDFHAACIAPLAEDATNAYRAFASIDLRTTRKLPEFHRRMTAPCLLIWGAEDPFFPLSHARGMLEELPTGSSLEVVPHAKLFLHEEFPVEFMSHAEPFLSKHAD